jgi:hypothetical protein
MEIVHVSIEKPSHVTHDRQAPTPRVHDSVHRPKVNVAASCVVRRARARRVWSVLVGQQRVRQRASSGTIFCREKKTQCKKNTVHFSIVPHEHGHEPQGKRVQRSVHHRREAHRGASSRPEVNRKKLVCRSDQRSQQSPASRSNVLLCWWELWIVLFGGHWRDLHIHGIVPQGVDDKSDDEVPQCDGGCQLPRHLQTKSRRVESTVTSKINAGGQCITVRVRRLPWYTTSILSRSGAHRKCSDQEKNEGTRDPLGA